jgi:uncharacterized protein YndB with AHSA1/START domain
MMNKTKFVYAIYISATPEKVWKGLFDAEMTRQYWDRENVSDWKPGSAWQHRRLDEAHTVALVGQVLESVPPRRLVLTWADPADAGDKAKQSRVTFEIEPIEDMVRLTVTHDELEAGSETLGKISIGWPRVLSSLKSFLETGRPLNTWAGMKVC